MKLAFSLFPVILLSGCGWLIGDDFDRPSFLTGPDASGPALGASEPGSDVEPPSQQADAMPTGQGPEAANAGDAQDAGVASGVGASIDAGRPEECQPSEQLVTSCGECVDCTLLPNVDSTAVSCAEGTCLLAGACEPGYSSCDGDPESGCEQDLSVPSACGSCDMDCGILPNTISENADCVEEMCEITCQDGYGDCNADPLDGCETDFLTKDTCGSCDVECVTPFVCAETSTGPLCKDTCPLGTRVCDGACVDVKESVSHCGTCGNKCAGYDNGSAVCLGGLCDLGACAEGFDSCDADDENGCETDLTSDPDNCGGCRVACRFNGASGLCIDGECTPGMCAAGRGDCDSDSENGCEEDLTSSDQHCGACGRDCADQPNVSTGRCSGSSCSVESCDANWDDCNKVHADGCEVSLAGDDNCGSCGVSCFDLPNVLDTAVVRRNNWIDCRAATKRCVINSNQGCQLGWADCDGLVENGCEGQLNFRTSCGECGKSCDDLPGVDRTRCDDDLFVCRIDSCEPGRASCDGDVETGCETRFDQPESCGSCDNNCDALPNVESTSCLTNPARCVIEACMEGWGDCDGQVDNGCERNLSNNTSHCGGCGVLCEIPPLGFAECEAGECSLSCPEELTLCDGACVDTNQSDEHCGACGEACGEADAPGGGSVLTSCVSGECQVTP